MTFDTKTSLLPNCAGQTLGVTGDDALLPVIFMALLGLSMLIYVASDGYDLGVGLLMHRANADEKDMLIASIGPFIKGRENRSGAFNAEASLSLRLIAVPTMLASAKLGSRSV